MEIEKIGATGPGGEFSGKLTLKTGAGDAPKGDGPGGGQGPEPQEIIEVLLAFLGGGPGASGPEPKEPPPEEPPPEEPPPSPPQAPAPSA
jgi:hypothetical protein